jgi:GGDEF domain-containing protein
MRLDLGSRQLARQEARTGLANRHGFNEALAAQFSRPDLGERSVALLILGSRRFAASCRTPACPATAWTSRSPKPRS